MLKDLRENPLTAQIPLIYVRASTEKSEVKRGMKLGANGYVRKPFDTKELMDAIDKCPKK